jgi:hypothetical protein
MVDETVFGSIVLGLKSPEESFLGTKNLYSGSGVLGEVHQTSGVTDESCSDQLANEGSEIGCDGLHPISQVLGELSSVLGDGDDLVTERVDVGHVGVGNLGTHGQLGGGLESSLEVLG